LDPIVLKAIGDYGVEVVALVVLGALSWWFIRDLKAQRDRALDIGERQIAATDKLTSAFHELADLVKDRGRR
jgi:hypothetical protein